ncbi:orotidine-5'-phosphate decarboxylase [Candidatus Aminicenantes bacterium AH-873-B07]|jgi:orotidine-5'-phosphate decarboxylase|nr:orotidine-5'-phosphate decarboxylase [Candidatus Aminicenantes bacterium AH-873-B07]
MKPEERIIIALDVDEKEKAFHLVNLLSHTRIFKIGYRLFIKYGVSILKDIQKLNKRIFLDLKLHDIPNTVAEGIREAIYHNVFMLTVHSLGGKEMIEKVVEVAREEADKLSIPKPKILAVTILTSLKEKDLQDIGIQNKIEDEVLKLAHLAIEAGIDGIVCSPKEIELLRRNLGEKPLIVTPGIRPIWSQKNDQKRIMTPREAIQKGADYLVIGRPIISASNPEEAFLKIINEIKKN